MYPAFGTDPTGGYGGVAAGVGGPYPGGSANSLYGGSPYGAAAGAYSSAAAGAYSSATGYGTGSVPTRTSPGSQQTGGAYGMGGGGRTCAMVRMETISQAQAAIKGLNGFGLDPQKTWSVKFADSDFDAYTKGFELKGAKGGNKSGKGGDMAAAAALTGGKGVGGPRREREPKESTPSENLYVKGLPPRVTEGQLHVTFAKAGNVVELKILRYGDSLECAALVRMDTVASAQAAIDKLNGTTPEGAVTPLTVCYHGKDPNNPGDNLYVKGLPLTLTQDHLHLLFGQCGTVRSTCLR